MLKGFTKELPPASCVPHTPEIADEFISNARMVFSMWVWCTVPSSTPLASLPVIVWAMGVGWEQQGSFQPIVLELHKFEFANIREHFDSNSTYRPAVCPAGWTVGNRWCSALLHIMGECWHTFPRSGQFGNVSLGVARAIRPYT